MDYHFNDIAGYEDEKAELKRLCDIVADSERVKQLGGEMPKGIIFYGEPGTGKTLFARVLASECELNVIKIDVGDVNSGVQICKRVKRAFDRAAKSKERCMIFFDELDKVLPNATEEYFTDQAKTILAQLLTLIDGMDSTKNFIFVATCNNYSALPPTLTRPGRIDKKIHIGSPSYLSRVEILKLYAERTSCKFEITMEELAKLSSGFSGAALKTLINECVLQSDKNGFISKALVTDRILEIKNDDIPRDKSSVSDSIMACRNIGALIVARSFNGSKYVLNLEWKFVGNKFFSKIICDCDDDYDDGYCDDDDESNGANDVCYFCKNDFVNAITVLLGGYAAEEIILNKTYDNVRWYFSYIDSILFAMAGQGMFGLDNVYITQREDIMSYPHEMCDRINKIFADTVAECYQRAKGIIEKNADLIKKLIPILVEKEFIDDKVCEPIIKELGGIKA